MICGISHTYIYLHIGNIVYSANFKISIDGIIEITWKHTNQDRYLLRTSIFDNQNIEEIFYNDENNILFINYKGYITKNSSKFKIDEQFMLDFNYCKNKYNKLQNFLKQLGFKK